MIVRQTIKIGRPLTEEELEEIRALKGRPIVFDDRIEFFDEEHSIDEDRWKVIGKVEEILFVVYTERTDTIRLISAREATDAERRIYYDCSANY